MSTLQNKAMLITLSVSCWTASKKDKKVSAEVEAQHNAKDAGRYNKLLIDKARLDVLSSYASKIRAFHYSRTMPWMDNGARLLPSALFFDYSAEIRSMKTEYERLVTEFLREYPQLVQDARQRLGTMFEPLDYPDVAELRGKFGVETDIMPVPDGQDFRVEVGETEREKIAEEISSRVAERQRAAIKESWTRTSSALELLITRLSAERPVIRESLLGNLDELARLLPGMNIGNDPKMDEVAQRIISDLLVHPDILRRSASARRTVVKKAEAILEMLPC